MHILVLQENNSVNHLASLADKLFFEQKFDQLTRSASTSQSAEHTSSSSRAPFTEDHALMLIQAELKSLKTGPLKGSLKERPSDITRNRYGRLNSPTCLI